MNAIMKLKESRKCKSQSHWLEAERLTFSRQLRARFSQNSHQRTHIRLNNLQEIYRDGLYHLKDKLTCESEFFSGIIVRECLPKINLVCNNMIYTRILNSYVYCRSNNLHINRITMFIADLFEKIVPIPVYDAMNVFEGRKSQITNMEIGRLREQTNLMNR